MKQIIFLLFLFVIISPISVEGEFYKYVDENGNVLFTDDISKVPEEQRPSVRQYEDRQQDNTQYDVADHQKTLSKESNLTQEDLELIKKLKEIDFLPKDFDEKSITHEDLGMYQFILKEEYGIEDISSIGPPDPKYSSPEKTWQLHKDSLMAGNIEEALKCFHFKSAQNYRKTYEALGENQMKELAEQMRSIEKITQDNEYAEYRILRNIEGKEITFYIYFVYIFGEWKIDRY